MVSGISAMAKSLLAVFRAFNRMVPEAWLLCSVAVACTAVVLIACERHRGLLNDGTRGDVKGFDRARQWPKAAVVLSVRGLEAGLCGCLDRLVAMDYPDFEVHIVIDHVDDPAAALVMAWMRARGALQPHVSVQPLTEISPSASLKCNSFRQALGTLGPDVDVVACVDADVSVHAAWLRDLVRPVLLPGIGASGGNRWYDPAAPGLGSSVRFIYNALASPVMHGMNIAWGGSLCLRRDVFAHPDFAMLLAGAATEECALPEAVQRAHVRLAMIAPLKMLSSDSIGLFDCFAFIRRQLIWTRLYHQRWWVIAGTAVGVYGALASLTCGLLMALLRSDPWLAAACGTGLAVAFAGTLVAIERLHDRVARIAEPRDVGPARPLGWPERGRVAAALPVALVVFTAAACAAAIARSVAWRGIRYRIIPPTRIVMDSYQPWSVPREEGAAVPTSRRLAPG